MKRVPDGGPIWSAWLNGGALAGQRAQPNGYVTVQSGYTLQTFATTKDQFPWGPVRWFQDVANTQPEVVVPNVRSIQRTESLDNDVATCTIVIGNTRMLALGTAGSNEDYGEPGALTFDRGSRTNRWGYEPNEWADLLSINALIRTYEGYGGVGKPLADALANGNVVLKGVWLVDEVDIATGGQLTLKCRSMAKLLVDQQVFPPLVPYAYYPINFIGPGLTGGTVEKGVVYGHTTGAAPSVAAPTATGKYVRGIQASADGAGYWLAGSDGGIFTYGYEHYYGAPNGQLLTNAGVTESYGAVPPDQVIGMALCPNGNGYWVATNNGKVYAYGAAIYEGGCVLSGYYYQPILTAPGPIIAIEAMGNMGYILVSNTGEVYTFGSAQYLGGQPGLISGDSIVGVACTPDGGGYWFASAQGRVYAYGTAQYFGGLATAPSHPITGMCATADGNGYYLCGSDGGVFAFGDAPFFGSVPGIHNPVVTLTDVLGTNGSTALISTGGGFNSSYNGAGITGPGIPANSTITVASATQATLSTNYTQDNTTAVSINVDVTAGGVTIVSTAGDWLVSDLGAISGPGIQDPSTISYVVDRYSADLSTPAIATEEGAIATLQRNSPISVTITPLVQTITLNDPVTDITVHPAGDGYWLVAEDGGVFTFADWTWNQRPNPGTTMQFYGSLPADFYLNLRPNYQDFADIVKDFLLWAGFYAYGGDHGGGATVYGNIESTGTHSNDYIDSSTFDKHPVIDAINTVKSIVGYLFYVGDEGEAHFTESNYWESGNVLPFGQRTDYIPVIDERVQITSYTRAVPDKDLRSQIIVASSEPFPEGGGGAPAGTVTSVWPPTILINTVTHRAVFSGPNGEYGYAYPPPDGTTLWVMPDGRQAWYFPGDALDPGNVAALAQWETDHAMQVALRGMVRPGMWVNPFFLSQRENDILAQLIALHTYFKTNLGQLEMLANPMIQIDDQVQIVERETFTTHVHYVRGIDSNLDLVTHVYKQTLTTNILSPDASVWAVTKPSGAPNGRIVSSRI